MAHYIDKDALVAEIERRKNICEKITLDLRNQENKDYYQGKAEAYKEALDFLNTLEVKEVDLEKEILNYIGDEASCKHGKWTWYECDKMIRYFFELGIKARDIEDAESLVESLEVKEVNLHKEIMDYFDNQPIVTRSGGIDYQLIPSAETIAKHFFELGLSVNNPITAADRGTAEEIIINLKRVEQDYHIDLTKEMEWVRNQVKKGD